MQDPVSQRSDPRGDAWYIRLTALLNLLDSEVAQWITTADGNLGLSSNYPSSMTCITVELLTLHSSRPAHPSDLRTDSKSPFPRISMMIFAAVSHDISIPDVRGRTGELIGGGQKQSVVLRHPESSDLGLLWKSS
jgi:hypothetical protein